MRARWSPDGNRIAFVSNRNGNREIYVMGRDGSNQTRLTDDPEDDFDASWSRDGERLTFSRGGSAGGIFVMNADGSNRIRLTAKGEIQSSLSPDGKQMVYCTRSQQQIGGWYPDKVFVSNADGSNARMLTSDAASAVEPSWSPDGNRITFVRVAEEVSKKSSIFLINAKGTDLQKITFVSVKDHYPVWSPDGSKIAFHSDRDGNFEIYVINVR